MNHTGLTGEIEFHARAPIGWDENIQYPNQTERFAEAMRTMGYVPVYVQDGKKTALVQIRDPLGHGGSPFARAYVYPSQEDEKFLAGVLERLRDRGLPFAKIGNTMWGVKEATSLALPGVRLIQRHTFLIDLELSEQQLLRNMCGAEKNIKKATKSGLETTLATSAEDIEAFADLCNETNRRIQQSGEISSLPLSFYQKLFAHQDTACGKGPILLLAKFKGKIIAGNLFLVHGDTMIYYQGGSTRDRELTALQGPTACLWQAVRLASSLGIRVFDFGGCTPDLSPTDSRHGVYEYKKRWGGTLVKFYTGECVLSPGRYYMQEHLRRFLWKTLHPAYFYLLNWKRNL